MFCTAFLNVCSLRRKLDEVASFLSAHGIHLLGIAETWLTPDIADSELSIPHYRLFRRDRVAQNGGGVAIYCHETIHARCRIDLNCDLEMLWVDIQSHGHRTLLGTGYRPPDRPSAYWDDFQAHLEFVQQGSHDRTVLLGDFNIDYGDPTSASARPLHNVLTMCNLQNHVSSPTRVTSHSATTIDLFLTDCGISGPCRTIHLDISDHFAVLACLSQQDSRHATHRRSTAKLKPSRQLHRIDWDNFRADVSTKLQLFPVSGTVDEMAAVLNDSILSTLDSHAPLVLQRKRDRRPCPWLTAELVTAVRKRKRLHRLLMKDIKNENLRAEHRSARSHARKLDRRLRNEYFSAQCNTSDQRKLWKVLNTVTGRTRSTQAPQSSLSDLSKTFGEVVHDPNRPSILTSPSGPLIEDGLHSFTAVSPEEIERCLMSVDPNKATGSDSIPGLILKQCAGILTPCLSHLINISLRSGVVPRHFKISHVSPLFKGGDPSSPKNYRPVSLLPIMSRILEYVVKQQLTAYLNAESLLPASQFAYRKSHSTEDAVTLAVNRWLIAQSERKYTAVVFVDMSKAFDRVQHERLISELFSLGISGPVLQWFTSYLSDRFQQVRVEGNLSELVPCSRGVPQGSVLGPLLFVLYTRSLHSAIPSPVFHQEFADDIMLDCSNSDPKIVTSALTTGVTSLAAWLEEIGLILNSKKTQVLFIRPRGGNAVASSVFCGTDKLETTATAKYLGVVLDCDLTWQAHVDHLASKTARTIGQLWRHGRSLTLRARRTWYISMIQSQLCYASNSFYPGLSAQLLNRLLKMSKAGLRAVFQERRFVPTAPMLALLGVHALPHLYAQKLVIFVHRCLNNAASSLLIPLFCPLAHADDRPVTRGQATLSLLVPFLPNLAGRRTIQFRASRLWNALPSDIRSTTSLVSFKESLLSLDISSLEH